MELKNVSKSYGTERVLENISLSFPEGSVSVIYGASGRGKTTLLRIIMGLEAPDAGELSGVPDSISAVFQEDRLPPEFSPVACVRMTAPKQVTREQITQQLAQLGLAEHIGKPVKLLSGGMKRRVAIVRAMLHDSQLVILDEPFTGMDADTRALSASYILRQLRGRTLIAVSHSPEDAQLLGGIVIEL